MTGIMTLSSKFPAAPPNATAASLPMTCVQTWQTASQMTGLTLPGMIDEPGCRSGILISPSPVRGPEPISRRSLQILYRLTAIVRGHAACRDQAVPRAGCLEMVGRLGERQPHVAGQVADDGGREAGGRVQAGADRGAAERQLADVRQHIASALPTVPDGRRVTAELLAERNRRRVHQVRPAALHHVAELRCLQRRERRRGG